VKKGIFFVGVFFFLAGCSQLISTEQHPTSNIQQSEKKDQYVQQPLKRPLTEVEQMMMRPPGKYSGANYDEAKVKAELDKLPANLTKEQYFEEFLKLLAEDYRPHVTTFVNFDPSISVNHQRPDENIQLPEGKKVHFSILLDASGSMAAKVNGKSKMDVAKDSIQQFINRLPKNATVSLGVYGHKGSNDEKDKALSCNS
jgi:D-amino-acid dehydrogenase/Ca-activated chloride channel family protein